MIRQPKPLETTRKGCLDFRRRYDLVMVKLVCLLVLFVPAVAIADGGGNVVSSNGKCGITTPADWSSTGPLAVSPDKKISIAVNQPKGVTSLATLKTSLKTQYKDARFTKDSPTELELEGKAGDGKPSFYRAIVTSDKMVCAAEARYDGEAADTARKLTRTLAKR